MKRINAILTLSVCFIIGMSMVIPAFENKRSVADILMETITQKNNIQETHGDDVGEGGNDRYNVSGLTFEDMDAYWTSAGVHLTNSYTDMNLTAKQVFVPDELSELTQHFTYDMQEWHGDQARFWVTLTYLPYTHADYGTLDMGWN